MFRVFVLLILLGVPASALTVPFKGWGQQQNGTWSPQSGRCLLREQLHEQEFKALTTRDAATAYATRLQRALFGQKMKSVVTQPVERAGQWGVLAVYLYDSGGVTHRVTELYLSDGGKLRTYTGSYLDGEKDACAPDLVSFIRYLAN